MRCPVVLGTLCGLGLGLSVVLTLLVPSLVLDGFEDFDGSLAVFVAICAIGTGLVCGFIGGMAFAVAASLGAGRGMAAVIGGLAGTTGFVLATSLLLGPGGLIPAAVIGAVASLIGSLVGYFGVKPETFSQRPADKLSTFDDPEPMT